MTVTFTNGSVLLLLLLFTTPASSAVAPPTDWTVYVPVSFRKCDAPLCFISSFKSLVCLEKGSCLQVTKWDLVCRWAFKHDIKQYLLITYHQCWGKLLLKIMHYNIALPLKKQLIVLLSYLLWKVMHCFFLKPWAGLACLFLIAYSRGGKSTKIFYSSKSTITLLKFYLSTSKSTSLKIYSSKSKK